MALVDPSSSALAPMALALALGALGLLFFWVQRALGNAKVQEEKGAQKQEQGAGIVDKKEHPGGKEEAGQGRGFSKRQLGRALREGAFGGDSSSQLSHPWLLTSLKGHSGRVLNVSLSENGKYAASCAQDRTVLVWLTKDFGAKEHKSARGNVQYDHAKDVKWSPDNKAYVVSKAKENVLEVYRVGRKDDGALGNISSVITFPKTHVDDIVAIGFASTGHFLMSCSDKTSLLLWNLKGEVLQSLDTYHMSTYCAKVSPCARFVASSGFTPDVKVWEVRFKRNGDFDGAHRAFELTGHPSGVYSFDFSEDSGRMVTLGKDHNWRLFDTRIDFTRGQDPSLIQTGSVTADATLDETCLVSLSPDATVVVVAYGSTLAWYDAESGRLVESIPRVHQEPITSVCFDKENTMVLTSGDKHVRVFKNVPGFKIKMMALKKKLSEASGEGMKERLKQQLEEIQNRIK